ncbi:MAG: prepilin-type N-terminal cleavage/methylation domain-containing protein [Conexibacter sp.]
MSRLLSGLRSARGFTLVELLVATTVGVGLLLGAFTISDAFRHAQTRVSDRSEAIARGRTAMEQIVQQLRSQVCLGPGYPAIAYGGDSQITFYGDLANSTFVPQKRDLAFASGALTERTYTGTPSSSGAPFTFASTPSRTRVVADKLALRTQSGVNVPFFRYYMFDGNDPIRPSKLLTTPLSASDAARVVQVSISYSALPSRAGAPSSAGEPFTANVYVRTADPTDPDHSPLCI